MEKSKASMIHAVSSTILLAIGLHFPIIDVIAFPMCLFTGLATICCMLED